LLPAVAITDTFPVANQAEMLALTAQRGDVAVRTDQNQSYILTTDDPTQLANWQVLLSPVDGVFTVNGRAGAVTIVNADVAGLLAVTDLMTYSSVSGTGMVALRTTITSPAVGHVITWDGSNWINQAPSGVSLSAENTFTNFNAISKDWDGDFGHQATLTVKGVSSYGAFRLISGDGTRQIFITSGGGGSEPGLFASNELRFFTSGSSYLAMKLATVDLYLPNDTARVLLGAAGDVSFARVATNVAKVGDGSGGYGSMAMQSLRVNNSAAATTPGSCVKKIEVFDVAGASLGFLPVFSSIS
jgi:hypothetical protein